MKTTTKLVVYMMDSLSTDRIHPVFLPSQNDVLDRDTVKKGSIHLPSKNMVSFFGKMS